MGGRPRLALPEFKSRSRQKHGTKYDYSLIKQIDGVYSKVPIRCRDHGIFEQTPTNHMRGRGCPECAKVQRWGTRGRMNLESFTRQAEAVHKGLYDYTKSVFIGYFELLVIVCRKHGEFKQTPNRHLGGKGCPMCAGKFQDRLAGFIFKACEAHGDLYDYSRVEYLGARRKVSVVCRHHGAFLITPDNHYHGHGCPSCGVKKSQSPGVRFQAKSTLLSDGRKVDVMGYEPQAIAYLDREMPASNLRFHEDVPVIRYQWGGKLRRYHPDLMYEGTLVEVKSAYTWARDRDRNRAKLQAALAQGYDVRLLVMDKNGRTLADTLKRGFIV